MTPHHPVRIVHVVNSLEGGGTERALVALLGAFNPAWGDHAVVTLRGAGALAAELPDHVACRAIDAIGRRRTTALAVLRTARTRSAQVIHARNSGCWMDAILAGWGTIRTRVVLGFHGLDHGGAFTARQRRIARIGLRCGATFTCVAESGSRRLRGIGIPGERITVLPNGVNLQRFKPASSAERKRARQNLNLPESAFVVGTVGSLTTVKRPDLLVEVARRLDARVLLIGDGPLREPLERRIRDCGLTDRVHLFGRRDNVAELLAALDVYVCPSDSEEMSNALLEAMAAGVPVVTTNVGDHARIVRPERDGLVAPPGDADALAVAIERLRYSAESRRKFAAASRARAEDFDFGRTAAAYEAYYASLTAAHAAPGTSPDATFTWSPSPSLSVTPPRCTTW